MSRISRRQILAWSGLVALNSAIREHFALARITGREGGSLISDGVITVGADATYPPHTFVDEHTHQVIGLDVDLTTAIAERLQVRGEFVTVEWSGIIPALQAKRYDAITAEMNITRERAEVVNFSDPVLTSGQVIVVKANTQDIQSPEDLASRTVLVPLGTTEEEEARKHTTRVKTFPTLAECFRELALDRGDALIIDLAVASYYIKRSDAAFKVVGALLNQTQSAFAFRKDDESTDLRLAFNGVMADMRGDGTFDEILDRWILTPPGGAVIASPPS